MKFQIKKYYYLIILTIINLSLIVFLIDNTSIIRSNSKVVSNSMPANQVKVNSKPLEQVTAEVDQIKQNLEKLDFFIEESKQLDFVKDLEKIASDLRLKQSLQMSSILQEGPQTTLPIEIILTGAYESHHTYLQRVENMRYHIKITSVQMSQVTDLPGEIQMRLKGEAYLKTQ